MKPDKRQGEIVRTHGIDFRRARRVFISVATISAAVYLASFARAAGDEFPIRQFHTFTWVVDAEPFWSPDGKQIVLVSSRHGGMKLHVLDVASANDGATCAN